MNVGCKVLSYRIPESMQHAVKFEYYMFQLQLLCISFIQVLYIVLSVASAPALVLLRGNSVHTCPNHELYSCMDCIGMLHTADSAGSIL